MKSITLNFREVATDALPKKSGPYIVIHQYNEKQPNALFYSSKHKLFNAQDAYPKKKAQEYAIKNVTHWMPLDEFNAAFEE